MLVITYTVSIILMILAPVVLSVILRRRFVTPWFLFGVGILTFTASQVVHLPLNNWLASLGILPQAGTVSLGEAGKEATPPLWQVALVAGLTAGLCEELARAGGYALLKRFRSFEDAVMLGLGHGGIEAMVFGGVLTAASISALLPVAGGDLSALNLTPDQALAVEKQLRLLLSSPWLAILPLLERLLAIVLHVVLSMIVWRAFVRRNPGLDTIKNNKWYPDPGYVLLAIAYHATVDAAAVYMSQSSLSPWLIEGGFALMTLPGAIWLAITFKRTAPAQVRHTAPLLAEWAIFAAALRKELIQQWRTKRVLVVAAVFGIFGMISPLLAYFTPQMLRAVPGAEQFADLVPIPTTTDALTQYIKNISQFGFILAILLGMGAVAGEKERGTASLILSKPMTRWAFVTSKFIAQVIVYVLGFTLAMIGAYFYALVLFGEVGFGVLARITLLLFAWLLPFVAVTLAGSVIAGTTTAAAGIALAGAVILLISSSIPQIGMLMPGALVGWAGQIGSGGSAAAPNGGALAATVVLTIVGLISAVAVFERQEL